MQRASAANPLFSATISSGHAKIASRHLRHVLYCRVKNELSVQSVTKHEALRQGLPELRETLLRLHKALIESERVGYERVFGKIASPYQFLQLLTNDPWFAWLRPLSQLVAATDEMLDGKKPLTSAGAAALAARAKSLLVATAGDDGFSGHYDEALQRDPDVVFAHAEVAMCLRTATNCTSAHGKRESSP
jgi:hypothetical protein